MDFPVTAAIRFLRDHNVSFAPHLYPYLEHGGTTHSATCLNVSEHMVIKTLVMETDAHQPLLALMHGDCEVSTKQLARIVGVKTITPCDPMTAQKHTGYMVGGTSPFGTRKTLPVYVEAAILDLDRIYINGGKRGFLVEINPRELERILPVQKVNIAIKEN
jgi:Cys-tRNA(Pro) deacylase